MTSKQQPYLLLRGVVSVNPVGGLLSIWSSVIALVFEERLRVVYWASRTIEWLVEAYESVLVS